MEDLLSRLGDVLDGEARTLDELLAAAMDKQAALMENDAAAVPAAVAREEELLEDIGGMERDREQLVRTMAERFGVPEQDLTLSAIIARSPGDAASRLRRLQTLILARSKRLEEVNRTNALLLAQSIELAQAWISAVTGVAPNPTYDPTGKVSTPSVNLGSVSARL